MWTHAVSLQNPRWRPRWPSDTIKKKKSPYFVNISKNFYWNTSAHDFLCLRT